MVREIGIFLSSSLVLLRKVPFLSGFLYFVGFRNFFFFLEMREREKCLAAGGGKEAN